MLWTTNDFHLIKRTKLFVLLFILGAIIAIHARDMENFEDSSEQVDPMMKYVIVDSDMGADDGWALQMLLNAASKMRNIEVLAITTVDGNTHENDVIKNTYRILDGLNRTDIPIYEGAPEAIVPIDTMRDNFFGGNGFSDIDIWQSNYPSDINAIIQKINAVEIIRDLVMKYPNQISLICIAPLTNIALAIKTYPEIRGKIKDVFIMGGNYKGSYANLLSGRGNMALAAEFNFYLDPEAAYIVLNSLPCPITIVPLETVEELHIPLEWRFNALGQVDNANVRLLNEVDRTTYMKSNIQFYRPYDAMLVAVFLFPDKCIRRMNKYHATVELQGLYTRGQMILNLKNDDHNTFVVEKVYEENFKTIQLWTAAPKFLNYQ